MRNRSSTIRQIFLIIGMMAGWFAVICQLWLILKNRTASVPETVIRFFSYFTILTNIAVAVCFTFILLRPFSKSAKMFSKPVTITALTLYIAVVAIIYNVILRFLWNPHGLQLAVDELLHSVIPVLFIFYWLLFVQKQTIKLNNILPWLIYPVVYCIYVLIRGNFSGFYPYPFIDVTALGYSKVFTNIAGMLIAFLVISLLLVSVSKLSTKSSNK